MNIGINYLSTGAGFQPSTVVQQIPGSVYVLEYTFTRAANRCACLQLFTNTFIYKQRKHNQKCPIPSHQKSRRGTQIYNLYPFIQNNVLTTKQKLPPFHCFMSVFLYFPPKKSQPTNQTNQRPPSSMGSVTTAQKLPSWSQKNKATCDDFHAFWKRALNLKVVASFADFPFPFRWDVSFTFLPSPKKPRSPQGKWWTFQQLAPALRKRMRELVKLLGCPWYLVTGFITPILSRLDTFLK